MLAVFIISISIIIGVACTIAYMLIVKKFQNHKNQIMNNFFKQIGELVPEGIDLNLSIRTKGGKLTVSIIPKAQKLDDPAQNKIKPLILTGTPEELDKEFFITVFAPLTGSTGLLTNMSDHEKSIKDAEANSKAEKERKEKEKKEGEARNKKIENLLKKVDELKGKDDLKGAYNVLEQIQKLSISPMAKVEKMLDEIKEKLSQNSLFKEE